MGSGAGGRASYLGQRPRAPPAAARPAAPGAAGAPRGGAAGAFLLLWRRRLPGRAQNIHGLCPGSQPPRPGCSPRRMLGAVGKVLCPSNLLPRRRPAASGPRERGPSPALRLQPRLGQPVSPGRSASHWRRASLPCWDSEERALRPRLWSRAPSVAAAAAPPAPRARSLALSLPQLVTFHQLSSPSPDQWQTRAQAGDPAPSAAAWQHRHPATAQKVVPPAHPRTPTSPPPPRLKPGGPRGDLITGETEAQGDSSGVANQFVAEWLG